MQEVHTYQQMGILCKQLTQEGEAQTQLTYRPPLCETDLHGGGKFNLKRLGENL